MESPFTSDEKRFILSEMIKQSSIDVDMLVDFVKSKDMDTDWYAMQLPGGRTLYQCIDAANLMLGTTVTPPRPKRKALGSPPEQPQKRRLATADTAQDESQPPYPGPLPTLPPLQTSLSIPKAVPGFAHGTQHVSIQPRPPHMEHMASSPAAPPDPVVSRPPASRKRGRPARADQPRHLRHALTQHLTPLAPRTPVPGELPRTDSQSTMATSPAPSPDPKENASPAKRRGRPPAANKSKPKNDPGGPLRPLVSTRPAEDASARPTTVPKRHPDTPETTSSSVSLSPGKDRTITSINHLKQEALAR